MCVCRGAHQRVCVCVVGGWVRCLRLCICCIFKGHKELEPNFVFSLQVR